MQPIPVKIKNVSVYAYLDLKGGGNGPVEFPIIVGAEGTYSVGTLMMNVFYNMSLSGGQQKSELSVHDSYYAIGEYDDGKPFQSHWMHCIDAGKSPEFGLTTRPLTSLSPAHSEAGDAMSLNAPPYNVLGPLTDVTVSQLFQPPAIGQVVLISNAKGNIIATKVGTPHQMGAEVVGGKRSGLLHQGMSRTIITGKTKDGQTFSMSQLTCLDARDTALFLHTLLP